MAEAGPTTTDEDVQRLRDTMAAAQAGDLARAFQLSEAALADGLEHPVFFRLRGLKREQAGRIAEAAGDFAAALADTPDDVAVLDMLGLCLARLGRMDEALKALNTAVRLQPGYAPAHFNRGWALESLGDLAGARAGYGTALKLDTGHGRAAGALALLAARAGRWDEAREATDRAMAIDPADLGARLARAMTLLGEGSAAEAEAIARGLLKEPRLPIDQRAVVLTLIGDAVDRQDRSAEAFGAYQSANETLRELYAARFGVGGIETGLAITMRLQRAFEGVDPAAWRAPLEPAAQPSPAAGHVFVIGFPRSGTTLLGQVLAAHPQVTTLDELETLGEAGRAFLLDEAGLGRLAAASSAELDRHRDAYWRRVRALGATTDGRTFVDKLPMNTLSLPLIARLFPEAKVVFVRRDPRDVILSCFRRQFVANGMTFELLSLQGAARFYDAVMRLAERYMAALELDLKIQRHEDLVADFAGQTARLCGFLGLPQDPAMARFAEAEGRAEIATPSAAQLVGGLSGEGVGQWKRYETQLAPVIPTLKPWIESFGY
ncbi:MAG TPA: sulfotransferase [Phenylobacterium sp.]|nr:sulfotransferase [Phenylobacterium sp.]